MKQRILLYFCILLVLTVSSAAAQDFTVSYISGEAFLLNRGTEEYLDIGRTLSKTSRILIENDSVVELEGSGRSLTLTGPGTMNCLPSWDNPRKGKNCPSPVFWETV